MVVYPVQRPWTLPQKTQILRGLGEINTRPCWAQHGRHFPCYILYSQWESEALKKKSEEVLYAFFISTWWEDNKNIKKI